MGQNSTQKPQPLQRSMVMKTDPLAIQGKVCTWGATRPRFARRCWVLGSGLPWLCHLHLEMAISRRGHLQEVCEVRRGWWLVCPGMGAKNTLLDPGWRFCDMA